MIHILVVDDDCKLNQAVCTYLNDGGAAPARRSDRRTAYGIYGGYPSCNQTAFQLNYQYAKAE